MTTKQLNFKSLPELAVNDNATSPNLGVKGKGSIVYSTTIGKALMWDGTKWSSAGLKGDKGDTGLTGAVGATGAQGAAGAAGLKGDTGAAGATGPAGAQGAAGPQGARGLQGLQGDAGAAGAVGSAGAAGLKGDNGAVGATGAAGPQGARGLIGLTGATGPAGLNGAAGAQGIQGVQGNTGPQGSQGIRGEPGPIGATGATGSAGAAGAQGAKGDTGAAGATGPQGQTGFTGATGKTQRVTLSVTQTLSLAIGSQSIDHNFADPWQDPMAWFVGSRVRLTYDANTWMEGVITTLTASRATFLIDLVQGTGSQGVWRITLAGERGSIGPQGVSGATASVATTTVNGLMASTDKTKLDGVASGANNYAHPANHPASVITQDASNRFVTDSEKTAWNAKLGAVKTINGQSIVGSGDLVVGGSSNFDVNIKVQGITIGTNSADTFPVGPNQTSPGDFSENFNTIFGKNAYSPLPADHSLREGKAFEAPAPNTKTIAIGTYALAGGVGQPWIAIAIGNEAAFTRRARQELIAIGHGACNDALNSSPYDWISGVYIGNYAAAYSDGSFSQNVAIGNRVCQRTNGISGQSEVRTSVIIGEMAGVDEVLNGNSAHVISNAVAVGYQAYSASNSIAVGSRAWSVGGKNSVSVGYKCGKGIWGNNNVLIGAGTNEQEYRNELTMNGSVVIGGTTSAGTYSPVFLGTGLDYGSGLDSPTGDLNDRIVMGSTSVTNAYIQVPWTVVSDARDKTNFAPVPHGLDFVKKLKPTAYQFRTDRESEATNGGVRYGFKAQDIAAIEPEAVIVDTTNPEKFYYNESNLIAVLVKAIQELTAKVERLENASIHP
jgi:hypothetical protein